MHRDAVDESKMVHLQKILGYNFVNLDNLYCAIVHPGVSRKRSHIFTFQRLEFLGDRVLGLCLAELLYLKFHDSEGTLAQKIAILGSATEITCVAKESGMIECFSFQQDAYISENKNSSCVADITEALLGTIYLESNIENVKTIITSLWNDKINSTEFNHKDAKSELQELSQGLFGKIPIYSIFEKSGSEHNPTFKVSVICSNYSVFGIGSSKKLAEQDAAKQMLEVIKKSKGM